MNENELLHTLFPESIWNGAPVADEPEIRLIHWSIKRDTQGNRYFVGLRSDDFTGRVSTALVEFDQATRRGRTRSGRVYELLGPSGVASDAEYVWDAYKRVNSIVEEPDEPARRAS
jgi:hypothetical protein